MRKEGKEIGGQSPNSASLPKGTIRLGIRALPPYFPALQIQYPGSGKGEMVR